MPEALKAWLAEFMADFEEFLTEQDAAEVEASETQEDAERSAPPAADDSE